MGLKKLFCKWGAHSPKRLIVSDPDTFEVRANCTWCGENRISEFGPPPLEYLEVTEKLRQIKKQVEDKIVQSKIEEHKGGGKND